MLRLTPFMTQRLEQAKSFAIEYGGSESNVAATLAQLGSKVHYVTRLPDQPFGHSALGCLAQYGVDISQSIFGGDRLGVYYVELGSGRRNSKVIYDRKNSGMHTLAPGMIHWEAIFQEVDWFHWSGITPSISSSAAAATKEAILAAKKAGVTVSCDLNYRSKLWDYGSPPSLVMPALIDLCEVVVGDEDVMGVYFGIKSSGREDAFEKLKNRFPNIKSIAFTEREGLSATHNTYQGFLFHDNIIVESKKYDMPDMIDRIGSGDAFMAGLIFKLKALYQGECDNQEVIEFATATSVHKHYIPGDINIITLDDVMLMMKGGSGAKVRR